jgi:hypothetical protein
MMVVARRKMSKRRSGGEDRVDVFDAMGFVDDNVFERELLQGRRFDQADFVRGNTHFKILRNEPARSSLVPASVTKLKLSPLLDCRRSSVVVGTS